MNTKNDKKQEHKQKNIFNYAIIMIICVIIIILFAAMADSRENEIDNRIIETERNNASIQNELVNLQNENAELIKREEQNNSLIEEYTQASVQMSQLTEIWNLISTDNINEAKSAIELIDSSVLNENGKAYYDALCEIINLEK